MMPAVQPRTLLLALFSISACGGEAHESDAKAGAVAVEPGLAPRTPPEQPAAEPATPEPEPAAEPAPPEPELDDRKLALANVGREAFDALKAGDFDALAKLTPLDEGPLRDACV